MAEVEKTNFYLIRLKSIVKGNTQHQVHKIDEISINGDFVESQAFGILQSGHF